jgi:heat shock protein HtpX
MAVTGTILFAFYTLGITVLYAMFGISLPILVALSVVFIGLQYKIGKWFTLRQLNSQELSEQEFPEIHRSVDRLSREMGIEKPDLYMVDMGVPNAFALGRRSAGTVAISRELYHLLDHDELEGVIAHELAHIQNRDSIIMQLGQSVASIVGLVAYFVVIFTGDNDLVDFFLAMIVSNIAQMLVMVFVFAISRYREYIADQDAAAAIGRGEPLARALEKISKGAAGKEPSPAAEEVNALCIFGGDASLFASHPPTEERIRRLRD